MGEALSSRVFHLIEDLSFFDKISTNYVFTRGLLMWDMRYFSLVREAEKKNDEDSLGFLDYYDECREDFLGRRYSDSEGTEESIEA